MSLTLCCTRAAAATWQRETSGNRWPDPRTSSPNSIGNHYDDYEKTLLPLLQFASIDFSVVFRHLHEFNLENVQVAHCFSLILNSKIHVTLLLPSFMKPDK